MPWSKKQVLIQWSLFAMLLSPAKLNQPGGIEKMTWHTIHEQRLHYGTPQQLSQIELIHHD